MTFDPAIHELITCSAVPLSKANVAVQPCSAIDDLSRQKLADADARRRRKVIADAWEEWRLHSVAIMRQNPSLTWRSWVNAALGQENLYPLTKAEIREHGG